MNKRTAPAVVSGVSHLPACLPLAPTPHSTPPADREPRPAGGLADAALLRRARAGDAAAREDLARSSGDAAFRFAFQLVGDRDLARDVAQDALVRLFATLGRVDPERPLAPWLLRIVRNRVIDLHRRERGRSGGGSWGLRAGPSLDDADRALEPADGEPGPLERSERSELQRLMWSCLGRLDPAHREILALRDYQDLSYREIAEVLDIPLGTVMSRLHAARQKLRVAVLATGYRFGGGA
jgi:RNA polymerase sigma-70 factor, ECF subfamily